MRIAYLDCFSGISGDMFLGALLDAGVPFALLEKTVADLNIGATLEVTRVARGGIAATKLDVIVNGEKDLPREEFWEKQGAIDQGTGARRSESGQWPVVGGQTSNPLTRRNTVTVTRASISIPIRPVLNTPTLTSMRPLKPGTLILTITCTAKPELTIKLTFTAAISVTF